MPLKILHAADASSAADDLATQLRRWRNRDLTILLSSNGLEEAPGKNDIVREALAAANNGTLLVVRLDETPAPVGTRDASCVQWSPGTSVSEVQSAIRPLAKKTKRGLSGGWLLAALGVAVIVIVGGSLLYLGSGEPPIAMSQSEPAIVTVPEPNIYYDQTAAELESIRANVEGLDVSIGGLQNSVRSLDERQTVVIALLIGLLILNILTILGLRFPSRRSRKPTKPTEVASGSLVVASYSRKDGEAVDQVIKQMERGGVAIWMDKADIGAGTTWSEEIVRAIRNSRGLILFCSEHAFESDHVLRELNLADSCRKPVYPVLLEAVTVPDSFLYYLSTRQILDVKNDLDWQAKLATALTPNVRQVEDTKS